MSPCSTKEQPSLVIVGSGSAAFAAAIRAVERGAAVTLIEGAEQIGGTCVNIGCVPSKIMIRSAQIAHLQARHGFKGLSRCKPEINRKALLRQQQARVEELRHAKYENILRQHPGIRLIRGWAQFEDAHTLVVQTGDNRKVKVSGDRILLATGARPYIPHIPGLAQTPFWTSSEALQSETVPQHLVVLGGSVVALELAQAWARLGVRVTLMARSRLLSRLDPQLGDELARILEEEGIQVQLQTLPSAICHDGKHFTLQTAQGEVHCDRLLVATGRQPNTDALALDKAGIQTTESGAIVVNPHLQTSVSSIYAAGDCTHLPQYVYVAAAAGTRAAVNMTGGCEQLDLATLPAVVFTDPAVATVGLDENQARQQGLDCESRSLPLENLPRALANFDTRGFIKLVAEKNSGRLLGAQILSAEAGEIIQSAALAIHNRMTIQDLAQQLFPYLTMVEGLKLCAQTFDKDVRQLSCCAG